METKKRVLQISYDHKLSHIGSCLTALPIIEEIFKIKKPDEKFVLSSGHAGLALYCVIEKYEGIDAEGILNAHGIHPERCDKCHLDCSTGSLGLGIPIAVGMALSNRNKNVYCLISDGECAEGSVWESLRIKEEQKLDNLKVYVNFNGFGAYKSIDQYSLQSKLRFFGIDLSTFRITNSDLPFAKGLDSHYHVMTREEYESTR
jgi:transketolase